METDLLSEIKRKEREGQYESCIKDCFSFVIKGMWKPIWDMGLRWSHTAQEKNSEELFLHAGNLLRLLAQLSGRNTYRVCEGCRVRGIEFCDCIPVCPNPLPFYMVAVRGFFGSCTDVEKGRPLWQEWLRSRLDVHLYYWSFRRHRYQTMTYGLYQGPRPPGYFMGDLMKWEDRIFYLFDLEPRTKECPDLPEICPRYKARSLLLGELSKRKLQ